MEKRTFLFDGKAKQLYATDDPSLVVILYKDDVSAYNGIKKSLIQNKGILNNKISEIIYKTLEENGVKTHFVKRLDDRNQLCKKITVFPLEFIVRNVIAGSLARRLDLEEGIRPKNIIFEICLKSDFLNDPLINEHHAVALNIISYEELQQIYQLSMKINQIATNLFDSAGIDVIDMKLEFGYDEDHNLLLADEISPDTARFWDKETKSKLDRDRFKRDMGKIEESYNEILKRLTT
ncbi:MAG: phosphoribosylaminoimidazolesuccinocarboxamide synthase [Bacteroidetes bacterium]|nr:phosphoribosylaminoimidazolesuccinocarboxamide synthase [Bacteroidota bacterium]MCL1969184.1 phosphoribosylaminoimidazolesuccinocarboxamide synthase [Bacteroidota bacterium]